MVDLSPLNQHTMPAITAYSFSISGHKVLWPRCSSSGGYFDIAEENEQNGFLASPSSLVTTFSEIASIEFELSSPID
jgi:hypothetical protein